MSGSDPSSIIETLAGFTGPDLTQKLSSIESSLRGLQASDSLAFIEQAGAGRDVLHAAAELKRLAGQINCCVFLIFWNQAKSLNPRRWVLGTADESST